MKMTDTSTNPTRRGHAVELFSGFGGLSLRLEQAGFDVDIGVDVEPVNTATHAYLFSYGTRLTPDLMENHSKDIRKALPAGQNVEAIALSHEHDAVVGGPPCQGITTMRRP